MQSFEKIRDILRNSQIIAIVGLSPKENRPSHMVGKYLKENGYTIIPVNPGQSEILGERCYASLSEIPVKVDLVDIFRKSDDVPQIVEEAVACNIKNIWLQLGILSEEASNIAQDNDMGIIMDRCIKIDHQNLL